MQALGIHYCLFPVYGVNSHSPYPLICSVDWKLQVTNREHRALINIFLVSNKYRVDLTHPFSFDKYISDADHAKIISLSKQLDDL